MSSNVFGDSKLLSSCNSPSGIVVSTNATNATAIGIDHVKGLLDGSILGEPMPYIFLPLADAFIGALVTTYETPIQFRQALNHGNVNYNVAAMYHPTALDIFGKKDMQLCLNEFASDDEKMAHEQVAIAYTFAYHAIVSAPASKEGIVFVMDNVLQLPMDNVLSAGPSDLGTPWGLAKARVDQISNYAMSDGWNADGSLTHTRK